MVMVEEIQPGWQVWDREGNEVGVVVAASGPSLRVKIGGREVEVPNSDVSYIETGRVELSKTKREVESGTV
jgi:hypothetical protein